MNELIPIEMEGLEVAQCYLQTQSIPETAKVLGIDESIVSQYLNKPDVKCYIDTIYVNAGYRSRFKIAEVMDNLIEMKLQELAEAGIGSSKDILEIMQAAHKMRMDELKAMAEFEKAKEGKKPLKQTNVQINNHGGENYASLLEKLIDVKD